MSDQAWPRVAVMGAGAVGCWFGGCLARAGAPVVFIGRPRHVEAIRRDGLFLEGLKFQERVSASASTDAAAAREAAIVLLCVKTVDTEEAARALAPHLDAGAIVVSLQNGVDNVERIREATGIDAVPAVVYVAAEMAEPGRVKHSGRGDLVIGNLPARDAGANDQEAARPTGGGRSGAPRRGPGGRATEGAPDVDRAERLARIASLFERAGVPCRVSGNIAGDLWSKLILNCAYNAISALARARYGAVARNADTREVMRLVIEEALAVAHAAGVTLPPGDLVEAGLRFGSTVPEAISSTSQDVTLGRRTEIDALNGHVARLGAALGVPTPANRTLHALVKLLEERP